MGSDRFPCYIGTLQSSAAPFHRSGLTAITFACCSLRGTQCGWAASASGCSVKAKACRLRWCARQSCQAQLESRAVQHRQWAGRRRRRRQPLRQQRNLLSPTSSSFKGGSQLGAWCLKHYDDRGQRGDVLAVSAALPDWKLRTSDSVCGHESHLSSSDTR